MEYWQLNHAGDLFSADDQRVTRYNTGLVIPVHLSPNPWAWPSQ